MNWKALAWGAAFTLCGVGAAAGWLPGAASWSTGPRIGAASLLIMFGVTLILMANAEWFLRKTTRPEDYRGGCPVGAACAKCGSFNMKPRATCRSCGVDLATAGQASQSEGLLRN